MSIRALTIWQPWASLMCLGIKRIETRGWATRYRGPLVIHAAKRMVQDPRLEDLLVIRGIRLADLPTGALLGLCDLVDCRLMTPHVIDHLRQNDPHEYLCGDYQPGRYMWLTQNMRPLKEPVAIKGRQGLWKVKHDIIGV